MNSILKSKWFEREFLIAVAVVIVMALHILGKAQGIAADANGVGAIVDHTLSILGMVATFVSFNRTRREVKIATAATAAVNAAK